MRRARSISAHPEKKIYRAVPDNDGRVFDKGAIVARARSMCASAKIAALRRLKLQELLAKVEQIEEQAHLTLDEYPHGHTMQAGERDALAHRPSRGGLYS
jgi:hypothetical protein